MGIHKDAQHSPEQSLKASECARVRKDFTCGVQRKKNIAVSYSGQKEKEVWLSAHSDR